MSKNPFGYSSDQILKTARTLRRLDLEMTSKSQTGHLGTDFSEMEILCSLYFSQLRYDLADPHNGDRDYFILSKGHGSGGYYAVLKAAGFLNDEDLCEYMGFNTRTPGHPNREKTPGVEFGTGALGHGLGVATGLAYALQAQKKTNQVFVLTGDGELEEGSIWEAAMFIGTHQLKNLCWIIDRNRFQLGGETASIVNLEPLKSKLESFNLHVMELDGQDPSELISAFAQARKDEAPTVVIAHTTKGSGVSFMENVAQWHHKIPNTEELIQAYAELEVSHHD